MAVPKAVCTSLRIVLRDQTLYSFCLPGVCLCLGSVTTLHTNLQTCCFVCALVSVGLTLDYCFQSGQMCRHELWLHGNTVLWYSSFCVLNWKKFGMSSVQLPCVPAAVPCQGWAWNWELYS